MTNPVDSGGKISDMKDMKQTENGGPRARTSLEGRVEASTQHRARAYERSNSRFPCLPRVRCERSAPRAQHRVTPSCEFERERERERIARSHRIPRVQLGRKPCLSPPPPFRSRQPPSTSLAAVIFILDRGCRRCWDDAREGNLSGTQRQRTRPKRDSCARVARARTPCNPHGGDDGAVRRSSHGGGGGGSGDGYRWSRPSRGDEGVVTIESCMGTKGVRRRQRDCRSTIRATMVGTRW